MKKPCDGYLLVKPIYEETSIAFPDNVDRPFNRAEVILKGNDITSIDVGDTIYVGKRHDIRKFSKEMGHNFLVPHSKIIAKS